MQSTSFANLVSSTQMKHKLHAKPSWACRYCYIPHPKPESKKQRNCTQCAIGKEDAQAVVYWDSQSELLAWANKRLEERAGLISKLTLKPVFKLPLKSVRSYEADWSYVKDGQTVVEDLKGMSTHVYKIKKELVELFYPGTKIVEVKARKK